MAAPHMTYGMQPVLLMIYKFEPRHGKEPYGFMDIAPPHITSQPRSRPRSARRFEALPVPRRQWSWRRIRCRHPDHGAAGQIQTPAPKRSAVDSTPCAPVHASRTGFEQAFVRMSILDLLVAGGRR